MLCYELKGRVVLGAEGVYYGYEQWPKVVRLVEGVADGEAQELDCLLTQKTLRCARVMSHHISGVPDL